jgi:hypothetical protein
MSLILKCSIYGYNLKPSLYKRFLSVDDEDLEALLDNKDSKNTKTCIKSAVNILTACCASRNILFHDLEQMSEADLCSQLKSFYAAVRSQKGDLYSKKSMISIRYGIQKHFLKIKNIDVVMKSTIFLFCRSVDTSRLNDL